MSTLSIGNELKDSFGETSKWVQYNLKWLLEVEAFYKERSKLEKEYSDKLQALTAEYFNKKSVASVPLGVGEKPTMTPGSIEAASVVAWNEILTQTELIARDHGKLALDFDKTISAQVNGLYTKLDMTMTQITGFFNDMDKKKNGAYSDLEKGKKYYDDSCQNMELARSKSTKSPNDRNKKKLADKEVAMNVAKNDYLIKISQANRIKDKYYFQDIPEAVDLLQDLNECRTMFLNDIWKQASQLEITMGGNLQKRLTTADEVVKQNKPSLGTAMFIKHNVKNWKEPSDFVFKPSPIWHDDEGFIVSGSVELKDLKVKLAESQSTYNQMEDMTQSELSKLSKYNKVKQQLKSNEDSMDSKRFYENLKNYLSVVSGFTSHETIKLLSEVRIESIQNNVPEGMDLNVDDIKVTKTRKNRTSIFGGGSSSSNTNRHHTSTSGKSEGGLLSKFTVKNLLAIDSRKPNDSGNHLGLFNNNSGSSKSHSRSTSHATPDYEESSSPDINSTSTSTPSMGRSRANTSATSHTMTSTTSTSGNGNKVLFAYEKQDDDEISVQPGDIIDLVEKDSGSGWTSVKNISQGGIIGLVPTTYIKIAEPSTSTTHNSRGPAPSVPPPRRNTVAVRTVTAQYAYEAQGNDEMNISPGDVITVIRGDDGSGWTFGELNGEKGLVPTSYCN
ncbi:protein Bzz1p [Monosporozyma unispora]